MIRDSDNEGQEFDDDDPEYFADLAGDDYERNRLEEEKHEAERVAQQIEREALQDALAASKCKTCGGGEYYPSYGVAPHYHSPMLGSVLQPRDTWPANFIPDEEAGGQCGMWLCPTCSRS